MKELAILCSIYVQSPDGWNEDDLISDSEKVLEALQTTSARQGGWPFEFQVYDAEMRDVNGT